MVENDGKNGEENFDLYLKLAGVLAVLILLRLLTKIFNSGPTKEQLDCFKIADDGGAMKRLNKDSKGRI